MLISQALEGKYHYSNSRHKAGIIQYATMRSDVYTNEGVYAYACLIRPTYDPDKPSTWYGDFYSTIYITADNN